MKCDSCGHELQIGEWPYCPHESARFGFKPMEPYWDHNISDKPVWITNSGDRNKLMRPHWENDHLVHVQERGKSESYYRELNQRRAARAEAERKHRS